MGYNRAEEVRRNIWWGGWKGGRVIYVCEEKARERERG